MVERPLTNPPSSRLYRLAPEGAGTAWIESLASYVNRLAWAYRIGPRVLVDQEITSLLNNSYHFQSSVNLLAAFCRSEAMNMNGAGEVARDWAHTLGRLTARSDLLDLTVCSWAAEVPAKGFLRASPAWCPSCYEAWQAGGLSIYQPLLWMIQAVTVCTLHSRQLEERCPRCQKLQSVIAATFRPGHCTQCAAWLGASPEAEPKALLTDETCDWQRWVVGAVEELRTAGLTCGPFQWKRLLAGIELCVEVTGGAKQLARLTGMPEQLVSKWRRCKQTPSFGKILELCYALNLSPLQLINPDGPFLKDILLAGETRRQPGPGSVPLRAVDRERARAFLQSVLDGRRPPSGVRQIECSLGLGPRTLVYHFPEECALISAMFQAYRSEQARLRMAQGCEEVRQVTIELYDRQMNPSAHRVASRLSNPGVMRT
ncbi:MAG TPA: TniQ family protein, partial [Ktedonobacteraceae bacterium]|nr:TniQ family protein [Ktedonobacteraceae bacterium]